MTMTSVLTVVAYVCKYVYMYSIKKRKKKKGNMDHKQHSFYSIRKKNDCKNSYEIFADPNTRINITGTPHKLTVHLETLLVSETLKAGLTTSLNLRNRFAH